MHTVDEIADWFLSRSDTVTNKKIQKLVYYAYAWYLVFNNESVDDLRLRFFPNRFEAWVHGPVYPELLERFKPYGSEHIPMHAGDVATFSTDELDVLEQVLIPGKTTNRLPMLLFCFIGPALLLRLLCRVLRHILQGTR